MQNRMKTSPVARLWKNGELCIESVSCFPWYDESNKKTHYVMASFHISEKTTQDSQKSFFYQRFCQDTVGNCFWIQSLTHTPIPSMSFLDSSKTVQGHLHLVSTDIDRATYKGTVHAVGIQQNGHDFMSLIVKVMIIVDFIENNVVESVATALTTDFSVEIRNIQHEKWTDIIYGHRALFIYIQTKSC